MDNKDDYKYLYKFEKSTTSAFIDTSHNISVVKSAIKPSTSSSSVESLESPAQVIRKQIKNTDTDIVAELPHAIEDPIAKYPFFVVDPLSLITKLAILSKKPTKTKISLTNHIISLHEPGIFQGVVRYYMNSTKQDLHHLQIPIEIACMQYIVLPTYQENKERFIALFKHAALGLENLASTYKHDSMVVHCINHYINIIHNAISMNSIIMSKDIDDHRKYYNEVFMCKMKNVWMSDRMEIVLRLVDDNTCIRSLEIFMEGIDRDVCALL